MRRTKPGGHAALILSAPCVSSGYCATRVFRAISYFSLKLEITLASCRLMRNRIVIAVIFLYFTTSLSYEPEGMIAIRRQ